MKSQNNIGEIPKYWEIKKKIGDGLVKLNENSITKNSTIKELNYFDTSSVHKGTFETPTKYLLNEAPSRAKRLAKKGNILISTVRPIQKHFGYLENVNENDVFSTGFVIIESMNVDSKYLYYYLTSEKITNLLQQIAESHTSTYPSFKPDDILDLDIPYPPIGEQKAIAKIFSDIDSTIKILQKQNKTLENMGKAIFKQWFVDFEFPNKEGNPYKSSGGGMIESELGEIPEGWEMQSLDTIANYLNGLALQKYPSKGKNDLPVIKIRELKQGITSVTDFANCSVPSEYIIQNGDLLFAWSGSLMVNIWTFGKGALNQHLFKVSSEKYPKWFYYFWTKSHLERFIQIAKDKATTMGHIQRKHLTESKVLVPIKNQLDQMSKTLNPILEKFILNGIEIESLKQTRDSLLPKLMTGKIRVPMEVEG